MKLTVNGHAVFAATGGRRLRSSHAGRRVPPWRRLRPHGLAPAQPLVRPSRPAVLAPDLPGHGRSEGPALASIAGHGRLDRGADRRGGRRRRPHLVGHSMGALVALETRGAASRQGARARPVRRSGRACRCIPSCSKAAEANTLQVQRSTWSRSGASAASAAHGRHACARPVDAWRRASASLQRSTPGVLFMPISPPATPIRMRSRVSRRGHGADHARARRRDMMTPAGRQGAGRSHRRQRAR